MPILNWLTREKDIRAAANIPHRVLVEDKDLSYGEKSENLLIQGDNVEALKALLPFYSGRIKCIFIDPPYNTGSAFEQYDDALEHSKWLGLIYPRLEILRDLLSQDGTIWMSIDDNEAHYAKVIMDEIFGRKNFVRNIVWQKTYTVTSDAKGIAGSHDHILVYSKSEKFHRNLLPRSEKQNALYKYDDQDGRGRWRTDNLSVKTYSAAYDYVITNPETGVEYSPPKGRVWLTSKERMETLIAENRVFFGKSGRGAPQLKRYLNEVQKGVVPNSWWTFDDVGHNDESRKEQKALHPSLPFATPKPERLLHRIIHIATDPGDLVLDSFLGSGTTAAVAQKMGRRWIGIEMGEQAKTHCAERLRLVVDGEQGGVSAELNWTGGGGFKFCTLGPTIFNEIGQIDPNIKFSDLARHIWFSETKRPLSNETSGTVIGIDGERAYALLYNGILKDRTDQGGNILTSITARFVQNDLKAVAPDFSGEIIVYAAASRLGQGSQMAEKIIFKQTPYDISVRG